MPSMTSGASAGASGPGAFNTAGGAPTLNTDVINNLLQQFGVMLPPGGFSDAGPFQQAQESQDQGGQSLAGKLLSGHPGVARAMDNALISAALTKPGRTTGENIGNVAQGLLGVMPFRRALQSEQAQVPLEFAKTLGGLQQQQAMLQMYSGLGDYYRQMGQANVDRGQAALERNNVSLQNAMLRAQVQALHEPRVGMNGQAEIWEFTDPANPGSGQYVAHPEIDPHQVRVAQNRQQGGEIYRMYEGVAGQEPDPDKDPMAYHKWHTDYVKFYDQRRVQPQMDMFGVRQQADPSVTQQADKLYQAAGPAIKTELNNLAFGDAEQKQFTSRMGKQIFAQGFKSPDGKVTVAPGDFAGSQAAAAQLTQQEAQRRSQARSQLAQAGSEYQKLIVTNPQAAQQYGSFQGFIQGQYGYDFQSHTFSQQPGATQNQAPPPTAQAPSPMTIARPPAANPPKGTTNTPTANPTPQTRDPLGIF